MHYSLLHMLMVVTNKNLGLNYSTITGYLLTQQKLLNKLTITTQEYLLDYRLVLVIQHQSKPE